MLVEGKIPTVFMEQQRVRNLLLKESEGLVWEKLKSCSTAIEAPHKHNEGGSCREKKGLGATE